MPTRRTPLKRRTRRHISEAAIAAWRRLDYLAMMQALGMHPAQPSPLPREVTALGVGDTCPPYQRKRDWRQALELQRELMSICPPDPDALRAAYEKNLAEAEECLAWNRNGPHPSSEDPAHRVRSLTRAEEEVAWRKELLADLDAEADGGAASSR